ncbi:hypothetical protein NMY22_g5952 [Coprinellus aureogranulatus]|nr:hypothetical protein NMY22_g5952 [Coprinellus aureogranulatus]
MSTTTTSPEQSPFVAVDTVQGEKTGRYIVMLKEGAAQADVLSSISSVRGLQPDAGVTHEYDAINGFAGNFDGETLAALQRQPGVASIVEDSIVHTTTVTTGEPWGLARISSERRLTGTESDLIYSYNYNDLAGVGVDIYIVTPVFALLMYAFLGTYTVSQFWLTSPRMIQQDFGGRASWAGAVPPYASMGTVTELIALSLPACSATSAAIPKDHRGRSRQMLHSISVISPDSPQTVPEQGTRLRLCNGARPLSGNLGSIASECETRGLSFADVKQANRNFVQIFDAAKAHWNFSNFLRIPLRNTPSDLPAVIRHYQSGRQADVNGTADRPGKGW